MTTSINTLRLNGKMYDQGALNLLIQSKLSDPALPGWEKSIFQFIREWISGSEELKIKTSGSTGNPKVITVFKSKMIKSALRTCRILKLKPGDSALLCLPVDYIAGKMMIVRAFVGELDLHTVQPSTNPLLITDNLYSFSAMTPMQVKTVLQNTLTYSRLANINTLIIGGGDTDAKLEDQLHSFQTDIFSTYGMTETLTHVALRKISAKPEKRYTALPGVKFQRDDRGCLVINDDIMGDRSLITNDIVTLISSTEFIYRGRIDFVINSGGIKINPEEVEQKITPFFDRRFVVVGISDPHSGERVVMVYENKTAIPEPDLVKKIKSANLQRYEFPKQFINLPNLPETPNGKLIRKKIIEEVSRMTE